MKKLLTILCCLFSLVAFSQKHPKVIKETVAEKNFLDQKTHKNSEIVYFTFADGVKTNMVKRNGKWYGYNIRGESEEEEFASKEQGLQKIWETVKLFEKVGGAIGAGVSGKSGPKKKDGTLDKRYKQNR